MVENLQLDDGQEGIKAFLEKGSQVGHSSKLHSVHSTLPTTNAFEKWNRNAILEKFYYYVKGRYHFRTSLGFTVESSWNSKQGR